MDPVLTEAQYLLRDAATKLAAASGGPRRARQLRDAHLEIDAEAWRQVIASGWLGTCVAEGYGGAGLGALDLALAVEEMGKQLLMVPLVEAAAVAWGLTAPGQTGNLQGARGEALTGESLIIPAIPATAWSFPGEAGVRGFMVDDEGALEGSVAHVPFAGAAHVFLVSAETAGKGRTHVLVNSDHLARETRRNVDGSTSSCLTAARVQVSKSIQLASGAAADAITARMQQLLALWTSAELLGVAQAAHDMTTEYLKLRKQFGKPIGSFQALQHRMVDCFVDLELSRSLLYRVLAAWDEGNVHPAMVPACKARISRGALATVRTAVQLHGAMGYTDEHDIGLYYKRAVALAAKYGNEICHVDAFSASTLA